MDYKIRTTTKYLKDVKRAKKRGCNIEELIYVIKLLNNNQTIPPKYKDHALIGTYRGCRELHINPDWLLIYQMEDTIKLITLIRTGTHSDLF
ncbi:MAG: type II toxin-antitoxin system YafQ family toxin [Paludibacter sp.]|nr:type II toxin-antitoxin system YafQ family toxin [Bacteroidales bacterium]MCM1069906.1 type II toxin-antitoxin system YafQ family toxin [Prevotella sp.]MCM1354587.1 type II toxin-antitoxin system YafQ family toxin [Bacteroides sp.]MCM1443482.1 type II toxin-antitoxin system YafQ family toxin [Muribaculum sp.]MCM1482565.1 type II toxin-antitoxin system YafQ family toxin [Paludibacter sp.]